MRKPQLLALSTAFASMMVSPAYLASELIRLSERFQVSDGVMAVVVIVALVMVAYTPFWCLYMMRGIMCNRKSKPFRDAIIALGPNDGFTTSAEGSTEETVLRQD